MKLVDDWKDCWRWASTNCMVLAASVQGAWIYIPQDMRESVPQWMVAGVTIGLLILGVVGRLFKQKGKKNAKSI